MSLSSFVASLEESGRVRVPLQSARELSAEVDPDEVEALEGRLIERDQHARRELAHRPPRLDVEAARWGAEILYRGCQLAVSRDLSAQTVCEVLGRACPAPPTASRIYSADLCLRFLPDLFEVARRLSPDDPLVEALGKIAREWPLSSVGCAAVRDRAGELELDGILEDESLKQLYVDRILGSGDVSRLGDPRVDDAVRASLGDYPDLAPAVAAALGDSTGDSDRDSAGEGDGDSKGDSEGDSDEGVRRDDQQESGEHEPRNG